MLSSRWLRSIVAFAIVIVARDGAANVHPKELPPLRDNGYLPPGIHLTSFREVAAKYGGTPRRTKLLSSLSDALHGLRDSGLSRVYVGGSFASAKPEPGDVDMLVPRQRGVDWERVVRLAKKTAVHNLHYYGARKIVTDVMGMTMTPKQRVEWQVHKPDFVEFFSQNRRGEQVGMIAIDLRSLDAP